MCWLFRYIIILSLLGFINGCSQNIESSDSDSHIIKSDTLKNRQTNKDLLQQDLIVIEKLQTYQITIEYKKADDWKLEGDNLKKLSNWLTAFKSDTVFTKLGYRTFFETFVIEIEGVVTPSVPRKMVDKRIADIKFYVHDILGVDVNNLPVFKTLESWRYGEEQKGNVHLFINRLVY